MIEEFIGKFTIRAPADRDAALVIKDENGVVINEFPFAGAAMKVLPFSPDPSFLDPGQFLLFANNDHLNGLNIWAQVKGAMAAMTDDLGAIDYYAVTLGEEGNLIAVDYQSDTGITTPVVIVDGYAISVILAASPNPTAAWAGVIQPGDVNTGFFVTAVTPGAAGNAIQLHVVAPLVDTPDASASASGDVVTVQASGTAEVPGDHATATIAGVTVTRNDPGAAYNTTDVVGMTVWNASPSGTTVSIGGVAGGPPGATTFLDVKLQINGSGDSIATIQDAIDAINTTSQWSAAVAPGHSPSDVIACTAAQQSVPGGYGGGGYYQFSGGTDSIPATSTMTTNDLIAAVAADLDSSSLIVVTLGPSSDGTGLIDVAFLPLNVVLAGGSDGGDVESTSGDVIDALVASPEASALVIPSQHGNITMDVMGAKFLTGGSSTNSTVVKIFP